MQIRKYAWLLLIILAALILIGSVVIIFNKRIRDIETKRQHSQSENEQRTPSITIQL